MYEIQVPEFAIVSFPNRRAEGSGISFYELTDYFRCYPGGIQELLFTALVFAIPYSNLNGFADLASQKYREHSRVLLDKNLVDYKTYDQIYRVFRRMLMSLWRYVSYSIQPLGAQKRMYELKSMNVNPRDGSFIATIALEQ